MINYDNIIHLYFRSMKRFEELEKVPKNFGTGDLLYSSEIHTVQAIGDNPGINLTYLADKLGITKSGASKFINKLMEKDLITKEKQPDNQKEVVFHLTEKGHTAYKGHHEFSSEVFQPIYDLLSNLDEEQAGILEKFLKELNENIDKIKVPH